MMRMRMIQDDEVEVIQPPGCEEMSVLMSDPGNLQQQEIEICQKPFSFYIIIRCKTIRSRSLLIYSFCLQFISFFITVVLLPISTFVFSFCFIFCHVTLLLTHCFYSYLFCLLFCSFLFFAFLFLLNSFAHRSVANRLDPAV